MNFEEYKAPRVQEINYVDFYVVKDFGKMGVNGFEGSLLFA